MLLACLPALPPLPPFAHPLAQVGDGTTTVVLLAAEFLKECRAFVEEGVHPQGIIRAFRQVSTAARRLVVVGDGWAAAGAGLVQGC